MAVGIQEKTVTVTGLSANWRTGQQSQM